MDTSAGWYNQGSVLPFVHAAIVALLTFSASGVSALVIAEPCTGYEQPGRENSACPPTCVTCGCCAQAVEPVILSGVSSPEAPVVGIDGLIPPVPQTRAREILHVPKLHFA
jgi:hypothetical protein